MGILGFVGKAIRFRSAKELRKFLEITSLHHPNKSKGELVRRLIYGAPNWGLQIVEIGNVGRHACNPAFQNTASHFLEYSSSNYELEAADIIDSLTKPKEKPLDTVDIFVMFLKSKRRFSEFCREFHVGAYKGEGLAVGSPISSYLGRAFLWHSTKKGHRYWRKLSVSLEQMERDLNLQNISNEDKTKFLRLMERNKPKQEGV